MKPDLKSSSGAIENLQGTSWALNLSELGIGPMPLSTQATLDGLFRIIQENSIKGFLADDEAAALLVFAQRAGRIGPCLEVGSYCGKSTVFLGEGCRLAGTALYAVDHHRGSEEHQVGEEYHDADLFDAQRGEFDSFPAFRKTLQLSDLSTVVIPVVTSSEQLLQHWTASLGLVFIDGGHSHAMALNDALGWSKKVASGGYLLIHDIFEKPEAGGQGPFLAQNAVLATGAFEKIAQINSMAVLKRY